MSMNGVKVYTIYRPSLPVKHMAITRVILKNIIRWSSAPFELSFIQIKCIHYNRYRRACE